MAGGKPQAVVVSSVSWPNLSPSVSDASPPQADPLSVTLEAFQGPLDLLLLGVRNHEVNIADIQLARITSRYLDDLLAGAETVDLEIAGEFLVLTATLLYLKSRTLLPPTESEPDAEEQDDAFADPAQHILEYQQFKEAAEAFSRLQAEWELVYARSPAEPADAVIPLRRVSLFDLLGALKTVLDKTVAPPPMEITRDAETVEQRSLWLLGCIGRRTRLPFGALFGPGETRVGIITTFLALLELIRRGLVTAVQEAAFGPILLVRTVAQ